MGCGRGFQNVSIEIRPGKDVQLLGILNGFPQVAVGGGVQVQLGDAYGDERRRVVFQLHVTELAAEADHEVTEEVVVLKAALARRPKLASTPTAASSRSPASSCPKPRVGGDPQRLRSQRSKSPRWTMPRTSTTRSSSTTSYMTR